MTDKRKLLLFAGLTMLLIALFMTIDAAGIWDYALPRRGKKIAAILLTAASISIATVVFQTITNNRILTPSLIGLDSLYMLLNTAIVFVFGGATLTSMDKNAQFVLAAGCMMAFAGILFRFMFRSSANLYLLLLVGIIGGTFFSSISSFLQMLLDPNEFLVVQDRMFASFNNVNTDILILAFALCAGAALYFRRDFKYLDVLALGKAHAVNLGTPYDRTVKRLFAAVALLVSVSTALVGPITFLGLLTANVAYRTFRSYRHAVTIPGTMLISFVALIGGQIVVEHVFTFSTSLSVIINFAGGIMFLFLLLKENQRD